MSRLPVSTDGVVGHVPSPEDIARIERETDGLRVDVTPEEGQRLSELSQQDSYSYELAHVFTGGDSEEDLREKYDRCVAALGLAFDESPQQDSPREGGPQE